MKPKPLVKAVLYALAYQMIGRRAYHLGLYAHPAFGLVLQ